MRYVHPVVLVLPHAGSRGIGFENHLVTVRSEHLENGHELLPVEWKPPQVHSRFGHRVYFLRQEKVAFGRDSQSSSLAFEVSGLVDQVSLRPPAITCGWAMVVHASFRNRRQHDL